MKEEWGGEGRGGGEREEREGGGSGGGGERVEGGGGGRGSTESGLDYFGPRYFGSSMGRFMSPDDFGGHILKTLDVEQICVRRKQSASVHRSERA